MNARRTVTALSLLALAGIPSSLAGPLDPPAGPISSTYKTLTEVEPRIAINAANTPGDANSVFRITQPGSYYLTGNVAGVSGKHGIEIAASHVTIDLGGFTVQGAAGSLNGLSTEGVRDNLTIRNGAVNGWGGAGVELRAGGTGSGSLIENLAASGNTGFGIRANDNARVRGCSAIGNTITGIDASSNAVIESCTAAQNAGAGVSVGSGSTVSHSSARQNNTGFVLADSSTISECSAISNDFSGIYTDLRCAVLDCTSSSNGEHGIVVVTYGTVRGNTCSSNGVTSADGAGISAGGLYSRVEGNVCTGNDWGIRCVNSSNFFTQNTCADNTAANWNMAAGNKCLVVAGVSGGAFVGNSGGVSPGSTDPNANFSY